MSRVVRALCAAEAKGSPVVSCTLSAQKTTTPSGVRKTLTAMATSASGQTATASESFTVQTESLPSLGGQPSLRGQSYVQRAGRVYDIVIAAKQTPRLVSVDSAAARRADTAVPFHRDGSVNGVPRWDLTVNPPKVPTEPPAWNIGVRIRKRLNVITVST